MNDFQMKIMQTLSNLIIFKQFLMLNKLYLLKKAKNKGLKTFKKDFQ